MAKAKSNTKATIAPASIAGMASMASMGLTLVAPTPKASPAAPTVALRGGSAISNITLQGAVNYRVACGHNAGWLASITAACKPTGIASVAALVQAQTNPVPTHFIAYCVRKGYVKVVA